MAKVAFIENDPDQIVADCIAQYEQLANRKLQPGQAERLLIQVFAYRETLVRSGINVTGNQSLVNNATGSALEELGVIVGVVRQPAAPALTLFRFQLVAGHAALTIPDGLRVQSVDGQAIFITTEIKSVSPTDTYVDIKAQCTKDGVVGNGYAVGDVAILLDPQPYVSSVSNLDITNSGNDDETDEQLRTRIKIAPSKFSVAGPKGAYQYFALSAHPSIIDVAVTIGHDVGTGAVIPGQVDIFPLLVNATPPTLEIIDAILAICNDDKIRPLNDTVVVKAPVETTYALTVDLVLLNNAVEAEALATVQANLQGYVDARKKGLGLDVVRSQIIGISMIPGVYNAIPTSPGADIVIPPNGYSTCTGITVNVIGTTDA